MGENSFWKRISIVPFIVALLCFNACTTMHFRAIAPPPPASKLRVAVLLISGEGGPSGFSTSHEERSAFIFKMTAQHLRDTGIYEVVSQEDTNYVVGSQALSADKYWWLKDDGALLKEFGRALHADYAIIISRSNYGYSTKYNFLLINIENGVYYSVSDALPFHLSYNSENVYTKYLSMYKKIFSEAKGDLLATAIRKGRVMPTQEVEKPATPSIVVAEKKPASQKMPAKIFPPADLIGEAKRNELEKELETDVQNKTTTADMTKLVVYDFNANEQLQVISLILSEALREELFRLGKFSLVNREDLAQVMQELSLQQSGLVDEKQIVKLGKWMAANEAVTGRFSQLGNAFILQAKRMDITTMNTLGIGSLKCSSGQEEELLAGLPELARKIAGLKK